MREKLTMATICDGAVQEKMDRALRAVADNIMDPNTDAHKKRTITMKITLQPTEDDREDVAVSVEVTKSLAPETGIRTQLFITKDIESGAMTIQEHQRGMIKGQLDFRDMEAMYDEVEEPDEPEEEATTGEVLDFRKAQG